MAAEPEVERQEPSPAPPSIDAASIWARIQEHKVLQWTLAYAGAALAIGQGQELMAAAFGWPPAVGRIVMALLVLGLPLVLTLAWYHGHKGLKQIAAGELMVVSVLLLVLGVGFVLLVRAPEDARESAAQVTGDSPAATASPAVESTTDAPPAKPRIAILPFDSISLDPNNVIVTDGMHEEILSTLANRTLGQLDVISRPTMMTFRGRPVTVAEVASALGGTTHVLAGTVRREGQELRLTLQLIDARSDR
jgi:TolB-like protein